MPSILYAGSEGEIGLYDNALNRITGPDDKRRGSVDVPSGSQIFRAFPSPADCWIHIRCWQEALYATNILLPDHVGKRYIIIENDGGPLVEVVSDNYNSGDESRFSVRVRQSSGYQTYGPFPHPINDYLNYDFHVTVVGTTLTVQFYRNEVLRFTHTAESPMGAWSNPRSLLLEGRSQSFVQSKVSYQDIIITDALPTVGMELVTLVPSAVGEYNGFSRDYSAINGPGYDPSTVISATATGEQESWIFADPAFNLADKVIYGVVMTTVAQTDVGAVIADFTPFLRITGVDYNGSSLGANEVAPDAYTTVWTSNPSTSQPWKQADLKGLEAGLLTV